MVAQPSRIVPPLLSSVAESGLCTANVLTCLPLSTGIVERPGHSGADATPPAAAAVDCAVAIWLATTALYVSRSAEFTLVANALVTLAFVGTSASIPSTTSLV
jgi:hypothetical protein